MVAGEELFGGDFHKCCTQDSDDFGRAIGLIEAQAVEALKRKLEVRHQRPLLISLWPFQRKESLKSGTETAFDTVDRGDEVVQPELEDADFAKRLCQRGFHHLDLGGVGVEDAVGGRGAGAEVLGATDVAGVANPLADLLRCPRSQYFSAYGPCRATQQRTVACASSWSGSVIAEEGSFLFHGGRGLRVR